MAAGDIKESLQRLWPKIQAQTQFTENYKQPKTAIIPMWLRWAGAAVVIGAVCLILFLLPGNKKSSDAYNNRPDIARLQKTNNSTTSVDTLLLSDGTMVILEPQARLYYPAGFTGSKREVYLEGNAFFKVTRNPDRPFYVYSRNIVTQVLGTSFFVKSNPLTKNVEVAVRTGKVAVYEYGQETIKERHNEESNGVILKPNQKVIYNSEDHHFRTTLVELPLPVVTSKNAEDKITELNFVFEETPIAKVLEHLEQAYHIDMVMENESLAKCLFSGDIKGQDLYDQLEIICASVQATYEIRGTRILIKGSGCE
jgi:transmembrane sensor